jgi:hypothetical protein
MAIRITRIDDLDGSDGAEAVTFELDALAYEIDLSPRNRARFLRTIRPFIERARLLESESAGTTETIVDSSRSIFYRRTTLDDGGDTNGAAAPENLATDLIEMARNITD